MARENFVLKTLLEKGEVIFKPHGNSMTPKIHSGDEVTIKKVPLAAFRVGDVAYCKVKGSIFLHLITAIDETGNRYQISNNHGHVNGWATAANMYGLLVKVKDKIMVTDEEIANRINKLESPSL